MKGYIKLEFTPTDDGGAEVTREVDLEDIDLNGRISLLHNFIETAEISIPEAAVYLKIIEDYKKEEVSTND